MNLIDFLEQLFHKLVGDRLPRKHQLACLGLLATLALLILMPESQSGTTQPSGLSTLSSGSSNFSNSNFNPLLTELLETAAFNEAEPSSEPFQAEAELQLHTDNRLIEEVRRGDNLSLIFNRVGLSPQDVYRVSSSGDDSNILTRLYPGYQLAFNISEENRLEELEVILNPKESYFFRRDERNLFQVEHQLREPDIIPVFKQASIDDSLFLAAQRGGISAGITMEIAGIFGGVIDFLMDTRVGDNFNVLYEEQFIDGEFIGNGTIRLAQYTNQGETYTAIRYVNLNGEVDYYNPQGESMRKAFLRNPVDFTRISSNFTLSRRHPILNTIRAHKGTDYAAPTGTPVVASGDGRITWASRNGSFGNLVTIQHGERFETKYAHLSSFSRSARVGSRVKQGDIIGYVGMTGGATGPHLHYEFLVDGTHRNPRTVHDMLPKVESVPPEEIDRFRQHSQTLMVQLNTHTSSNQILVQNSIIDSTE
jgi:murein DD-endopeptidase MepM/ murein hydrolase activator NlpD